MHLLIRRTVDIKPVRRENVLEFLYLQYNLVLQKVRACNVLYSIKQMNHQH